MGGRPTEGRGRPADFGPDQWHARAAVPDRPSDRRRSHTAWKTAWLLPPAVQAPRLGAAEDRAGRQAAAGPAVAGGAKPVRYAGRAVFRRCRQAEPNGRMGPEDPELAAAERALE